MSGARVWPRAALAALVPFAFLAWHFRWLCDDACISFRYARHFAGGAGLAFNPGETTPVEGYSNLLWVLWLSLGEFAGVAATLLAPWSSLACGAALIALVARRAEERGDAAGAWAAALFLGTLGPLGLWATGGLETMAFALALFALLASLERGARLSALAPALVAVELLRNDGFLWAGALLVAALACGGRERRALALRGLGLLALVFGAHTLFRWGYHGDLVPNTARVKGGLDALRAERGARYVAGFLCYLPGLLAVALASPLGASALRAQRRLRLALVLFAAALAVAVGGDFLPLGRFFVPVLAPLALLWGDSAARLAQRSRALALGATACLCTLGLLPALDVAPTPRAWRDALDHHWSRARRLDEFEGWRRMRDRAREDERLAAALAAHTRAGESLVRDAIGVVGYRTQLVLLDRFGLVDREVARLPLSGERTSPGHDRFVDVRWFLHRRPTYLDAWLVPAGAPSAAGVDSTLAGLFEAGRAAVESFPAGGGADLRLLRFLPE